MKGFLRKKWAIAAVVLAVALIGVGIAIPALAQTATPPATASTGVYLDSPTIARVADALGLTTADLTAQLQAGNTLAEIAAGKTDAVVDAIIAPHAEQLALRVKYGYLTQEQADAMLQTMTERADAMLQEDFSETGYQGYGGGWGYCGGYGAGGFGGVMRGFSGMMSGLGGRLGGMMGGWGGNGNGTATTPSPAINRGGGWGMMGRW